MRTESCVESYACRLSRRMYVAVRLFRAEGFFLSFFKIGSVTTDSIKCTSSPDEAMARFVEEELLSPTSTGPSAAPLVRLKKLKSNRVILSRWPLYPSVICGVFPDRHAYLLLDLSFHRTSSFIKKCLFLFANRIDIIHFYVHQFVLCAY